MIWEILRSKGGIVIRKPVRLMLCILFSIAILTAYTAPTPAPTTTPMPTATPEPTATLGAAQPSKLGYHDAAYDIKADRVIVFGGEIDPDHGLSDTWTYDITANTWVKMSPAQCPCGGEGPMAYDSASDRMIFYAGNSAPGGISNLAAANQTWAYDYNTDTWTDLHANGTPSGLLGARMVYDTKADRMILFGGLNVPIIGTYNTNTWVYDFNTNKWTNMHPKTSPPSQYFFQMTYDAASDRVLAWITPDAGGSNTMWAYDFETNTWTAQLVKEPASRISGAMVYVPTVQRDFVFGGVTLDFETTPPNAPFDDMWTYDSVTNTWEQVNFASGPSARGWHTLTYSTKADRLVLIGGGKDEYSLTNEVWIFDPHAKTWTQVG
jgi:N-acetylneuraminic acid mutarotase